MAWFVWALILWGSLASAAVVWLAGALSVHIELREELARSATSLCGLKHDAQGTDRTTHDAGRARPGSPALGQRCLPPPRLRPS